MQNTASQNSVKLSRSNRRKNEMLFGCNWCSGEVYCNFLSRDEHQIRSPFKKIHLQNKSSQQSWAVESAEDRKPLFIWVESGAGSTCNVSHLDSFSCQRILFSGGNDWKPTGVLCHLPQWRTPDRCQLLHTQSQCCWFHGLFHRSAVIHLLLKPRMEHSWLRDFQAHLVHCFAFFVS